MTDLRFGVSLAGWSDGPALLAAARTAEREGFDAVTVADHLGHTAPFAVLAAAAAVTSRVRLRTYVLDAYFWNPALLAREVATLDLLSGGRLELGIGAGHMRHEHVDAGLPFPSVDERWVHTAAVLAEVRRRLADETHVPAPVQRAGAGAGGGDGRARAAGARPSTPTSSASPAAAVQVAPGRPAPATFTLTDAATTDERVALVREVAAAHGRAPRAGRAAAAGGARRRPRGDRGGRGARGRGARDGLADARAAARHPVRAVRRVRGGRRRGAGPPGAAVGRAQLEHARPVGAGAGAGSPPRPEPDAGSEVAPEVPAEVAAAEVARPGPPLPGSSAAASPRRPRRRPPRRRRRRRRSPCR